MATFLSAEWFSLLASARIAADPTLTFTLDQVVTGGPDGDIRYRVTIAGGGLRVTRADAGDPADATLRLAFHTAVDLASGRRPAHDAFLGGEVTFSGDLRRLQAVAAALAGLAGALGHVQDHTTYPASA